MIDRTYDFLAPRRIVFGWGKRRALGALAATLGNRAWIVCGSRTLQHNGTLDELQQSLVASDLTVEHLVTLGREPEVTDVDEAVTRLRQ